MDTSLASWFTRDPGSGSRGPAIRRLSSTDQATGDHKNTLISSPVPSTHVRLHDIELGYGIVADVLGAREAAELLRSLEQSALGRSRAGARHLMRHPSVHALALDPRMLAIATAFVGPDAVPYR